MLVQFGHPLAPHTVVTLVAGSAGVYLSAQARIQLARQAERLKEQAASTNTPAKTSHSAAA